MTRSTSRKRNSSQPSWVEAAKVVPRGARVRTENASVPRAKLARTVIVRVRMASVVPRRVLHGVKDALKVAHPKVPRVFAKAANGDQMVVVRCPWESTACLCWMNWMRTRMAA